MSNTAKRECSISYQGNAQKNKRDEVNLNPDHHIKSQGNIFSVAYRYNVTKNTNVYAVGLWGTSTEKHRDQFDSKERLRQVYGAVGFQHIF